MWVVLPRQSACVHRVNVTVFVDGKLQCAHLRSVWLAQLRYYEVVRRCLQSTLYAPTTVGLQDTLEGLVFHIHVS